VLLLTASYLIKPPLAIARAA